jgi:3-deoxy-D-manno-octulosonic-acid transferase
LYTLYSLLLAAGFAVCLPWFLWKAWANGKYVGNVRERLGRVPAGVAGGPSIWVHAVSVGEILAARPLVAALKERFPRYRLVVSTTTRTGHAVARRQMAAAGALLYAPFDWPGPVRRTLAAVNPVLLILVETEIWPNLIHEARRRGARVALVNGRISVRSFGRYRRVRRWLSRVLAEVDLFLMQGKAHADRLEELGAPANRVRVLGNLKFDAPAPAALPQDLARLLASRAGRPLWVAGSTVAGEEASVLRAFGVASERVPGLGLLLAPRHPERFGEVAALVEAAGFACQRRSARDTVWSPGAVLLLDTLGELAHVYPIASVVFVGGSLVPAGGHNILEAAVAGRAVVVGPHMENFREIADTFRAEDAFVEVATAEALGHAVGELLGDDARRRDLGERARSLVEQNRGALQRTVDALADLVA